MSPYFWIARKNIVHIVLLIPFMLLLIIFDQSKLMLHLEHELNELARANLKIRGSCSYHGNLHMCSV